MVSGPDAIASGSAEFTSGAPGMVSTDVPCKPRVSMKSLTAPHHQFPVLGMFRPMQAVWVAPSSSTAYYAAPSFEGRGPRLVDTMFGVSEHSEIAQAEAMAMIAAFS